MDLVFTAKIDILVELSGDMHLSPEDMMLWVEEQLELGFMTIDEAVQYLADFNYL